MTISFNAVRRYLRMLPLVCVLVVLGDPVEVQAACTIDPGSGAPTCGSSGVATQGNTSGTSQAGGNPINVINGNKYQREVDLPALPGVLGLEIVRHYNSTLSGGQDTPGILGRGWRLSYDTELTVSGSTIEIAQADGTIAYFSRDLLQPDAPRVLYRAASPLQGKVWATKTQEGTEYTWIWQNGKQLNFNAAGKLVQIVAPTGEFLTLQRDARGWLVKVTDPQGRSLHLNYLDTKAIRSDRNNERFRGVQSIDSPVGRFTYTYGSTAPAGSRATSAQLTANLVKVGIPTHYDADQPVHAWTERGVSSSSISRLYHYENAQYPTLLTGISVLGQGSDGKLMNQRIVTWGYDSTGRANLSVKGEPARYETDKDGKIIEPKRLVAGTGIEQVTMAWPKPGETVLTNSLGQQTTYKTATIAGERRILEVRGAGCASCGPSNMRYGYDSLGRLIEETQLSANGEPQKTTRTERDGLGRVLRISTLGYRNGKAQAPQWQVRYAYGSTETDTPNLVAKPSVVPGKEYVTRIRYGDTPETATVPVEITETGFIPTIDGNGVAQSIIRTLHYRYNRLGQRIETDGPLPNAKDHPGPANSDITLTEYDPKTKLAVKTIAPGGMVTEVLERDGALRPSKIRTIDGAAVHTAAIRSNWRGQPEEITVESAFLTSSQSNTGTPVINEASKLVRTLRYRYDANGNLTDISLPGGLEARLEYDVAGQLTHRILPDGSRVTMSRNTEDWLQNVATYSDGNTTQDKALARLQYTYDAWGRPVRVEDQLGLLHQASYTDIGTVTAITNAMGATLRLSYDDNGMLSTRTEAADTPQAATLKMRYDSHGQPTVITDANGVTTQRRYDDFGRKIVEVSPDRGITLYRYDMAGRMIARIDETGVTTRYRYDPANRLMALGADKQTDLVQYHYDGQRLMGVTSTADGNAAHAVERTTYQYNAWGQATQEIRWIARVDMHAASTSDKNNVKPLADNGLQFITCNRYDDAARLVEQVLPDGHRLTYRYTASSESGKANGKPGQLNAILFDDHLLVSDIKQNQATGLTGYIYGNGVRQEVKLDGRGRIVQWQAIARNVSNERSWWQQLTAWFTTDQPKPGQTIYRQINRYDAANRLTEIERSRLNPASGAAMQLVRENYGYDALDRLTELQADDGTRTQLRYDRGGNRIAETTSPTLLRRTAAGAGAVPNTTTHSYQYVPGTNRLAYDMQQNDEQRQATAPETAAEAVQLLRTAWLYHPTGVPLAQLVMSAAGNMGDPLASSRRIVYNAARRPIAVYDEQNRLLARYHYNLQGERIAKTLYANESSSNLRQVAMNSSAAQGNAHGRTIYSLYRNQRLAAEADDNGQITAHYIYLNGKPVAKIDMTVNDSLVRRTWRYIVTMGGMIKQENVDPSDSNAAIYAIHTDHLGTPQVVTDALQQIVWQAQTDAFGKAKVTYAAMATSANRNGKRFEMNLRLPGQVYDEETGLHDNYYRDYDPATGRYTTPDPMGLAGGVNPYAYVSNNPLTNVDPLGLYEEDVHYYMTYFLAKMAGINNANAYTISLGDQFIDEDPLTWPLDEKAPVDNLFSSGAINRLSSYHFTTTSPDWYNPINYDLSRSFSENAYKFAFGAEAQSYIDRRYKNPSNPQLNRLAAAYGKAPTTCAKAQLFGEYLHAFEDTFGHRDQYNAPIDVNRGVGHGTFGHSPDKTYNHVVTLNDYLNSAQSNSSDALFFNEIGDWNQNEARTYEMEYEVWIKMRSIWGTNGINSTTGKKIAFKDFADFLEDWNKIKDTNAKIAQLNSKLKEFGFDPIPLFNKTCADAKRSEYIGGLNSSDYSGVILPTTKGAEGSAAAACPK